jgi:hypothetical protein
MRIRSPALAAAPLAATLLSAHSAGAFERQWHLGAGLGASSYAGTDAGISPAIGAYGAYGLSDMFDLRLELVGSHHEAESDRNLDIFSVSGGVAYKLDVLEWIPYAGVLGGYYYFRGDPEPEFENDLALSLILGLDYAWSRSLGFGVALQYHGLLLGAPESFTEAAYFTGLFRIETRFGW